MDAISFRILSFPVRVQPSFFLTVGVMFLFQLQGGGPVVYAFLWGAVVFVSVLLHELGHAAMARSLGVPVGTIELHALGGHVPHGRTTPGRGLLVSLAGPGAGLLLGAGTLLLGPFVLVGEFGDVLFRFLVFTNIVWSLFNLLPLNPLDGGHALQAGLSLAMAPNRAWRITSGVGVLLGALLLAVGLQSGMFMVAWIGGSAAYTNWNILQQLPR